MPQLSIVIPTHKRADILRNCLDSIENQTVAKELEVIVVSDGHDDETCALFAKKSWSIPIQFLEIKKSQQGSARNRGIQEAKAPFCLFIGDDIFLEKDACEKHLSRLTTHDNTAVLGFATWDPAIGITSVMRWLEKSGWQFGYPKIARFAHATISKSMQHQFTYTSHISLPTVIAKKFAFREDITMYGWEDIEWGMRLRDAGVKLLYEPGAKAIHHHKIELKDSLKRMEILGKSAALLSSMIPNFDRLPQGWKLYAYYIAASLPTMAGRHRKAFLRGIQEKS